MVVVFGGNGPPERTGDRARATFTVDPLAQRHALVHVVQELDFVAELRTQVFEELRQHANVGAGSQIARGLVGPMASFDGWPPQARCCARRNSRTRVVATCTRT